MWALGTRFSEYGFALFVIVPIATGVLGSLLLNAEDRPYFRNHVRVSFWACAFGLLLSIFLATEGFVCVLMASPLYFILLLMGNGIVYGLRPKNKPSLMVTALALIPAAFAMERAFPATDESRSISTEVVIDASAESIWPLLQNLKNLPPPDFWMFRMGVAHPVGTRMQGSGLGASRWCDLSTGPMRERIVAWEPNRELSFKVLDTPPSMREWNPFGEVKAAHLKGYFECEAGRFELTSLAGGKTKLVGTTWYHHRFRPAMYWNLWTDKIVREVQWRVMSEIARRAQGLNRQ